jgi:hypothetical protein
VELKDYGASGAGSSTVPHDQFVNEILAAFTEWKDLFQTLFPGLTVHIINLGDEPTTHQEFSNCIDDDANGYPVGPAGDRIGDFRIGMIPFTDGLGGTLARTYPPPNDAASPWRTHSNGSCSDCGSFYGDIHFDSNENWRRDLSDEGQGYSIKWVAAHEIGHAFGLAHDSNDQALMFPSATFSYSFAARFPDGLEFSLAEKCAAEAAYDGCGASDPEIPPNPSGSSDDSNPSSDPSESVPSHPSQTCDINAAAGTAGSKATAGDLTIANQITRQFGHWGYLECDQLRGPDGTGVRKPGYLSSATDLIFDSKITNITPTQICASGADRPCGTNHSGQGLRYWFLYSGTNMNGQAYRVNDRIKMWYPITHAWNVDGTLLQLRADNVPYDDQDSNANRGYHPWESGYVEDRASSSTERFLLFDGSAHVFNGVGTGQRTANTGKALIHKGAFENTAPNSVTHEPSTTPYSPLMYVNASSSNIFWSLNKATRQHAYSIIPHKRLVTHYKNEQGGATPPSGAATSSSRQYLREFSLPFFTLLTSKMTAVFPARYKNASNGLTFTHATRKDKAITAATTGSPIQVTSAGHDLKTGQKVVISGVVGQTRILPSWVTSGVTTTGLTPTSTGKSPTCLGQRIQTAPAHR